MTPIFRGAARSDWPPLRAAFVELQERERWLHGGRLPREEIADAYLEWMTGNAAADGAVLIAEIAGVFAGFAACWIENEETICLLSTKITKKRVFSRKLL